MNRRRFAKTLGMLAGASALTGFYAWKIEPHWLEFVRQKIHISNLPPHLKGTIVMQISDIHVGKVDKEYLIKSFKEASLYKPDIVVYTGDFISFDTAGNYTELKEVLKYAVKGVQGTVGILGNHDYGKNWSQPDVADAVTAIAKDAGITVLRNNNVLVSNLNIIGIDDLWGTNFNPEMAMSKYNPGIANLVLSHNPDTCDLDIWNNYEGWILAGHTHGGQCKPPFLPPPILPVQNKKYSAGEINLGNNRTVYINRALGHYLPVRFNVRPEITLFELQTI
ncbi:metallophosphoesterase [Niabella ginsengisoli]|uniref:Metallophosphoesterase n=1 Tax=Niabella ginsengisoli TaxID=522298 RepID=A0ABS9SEM5_9BACT|nr:metallophosphoesterase [Niabella ginsengisoli]MCH5596629.1 metallophosphoesterase [Niabella ginsengisoli]